MRQGDEYTNLRLIILWSIRTSWVHLDLMVSTKSRSYNDVIPSNIAYTGQRPNLHPTKNWGGLVGKASVPNALRKTCAATKLTYGDLTYKENPVSNSSKSQRNQLITNEPQSKVLLLFFRWSSQTGMTVS